MIPEKFCGQVERFKEATGVRYTNQLASLLKLTENAFNVRKYRDSFPAKELTTLSYQRPELGIDVQYILFGGKRTTQVEADRIGFTLGLDEQTPAGQFARMVLFASTHADPTFLQPMGKQINEAAALASGKGQEERARRLLDDFRTLSATNQKTVLRLIHALGAKKEQS